MKKTLIFLFFWLVLVNLFAFLVMNRFNLKGDTAYQWIDPSKVLQEQSWDLVGLHKRWDSFWYTDIAAHGYRFIPNNTLANIVFFPVYPFLMRFVSIFLGGNLVLAAWLISIAALFGAIAVFYKLLKEFHPSIDPDTPIFYLLIFPTAFFLNAVYTESLFLFLSLLTFYYAMKGRFGMAGMIGFAAALTRVTGLLLFIPVAWEYWKRYGKKGLTKPEILPTLLIPLGTFLFFLYHKIAFGNFLLFFEIESAWGRSFQINLNNFVFLTHPAVVNFALDMLFSAFAFVAVYLVMKRGWTAYGLYMLATLAVALGTGTMSIGRYILVLFPMYIALASIKNQHFERMYSLASILLLSLNITLFVNWYWAG